MDAPEAASWWIAARAMAVLASAAAIIGVYGLRGRERVGGYWLLGWAALLVAGTAYLAEGAGVDYALGVALVADAFFAPLMLAGTLSLGGRHVPVRGLVTLAAATGVLRIAVRAADWPAAEAALGVTVGPACFAAAAFVIAQRGEMLRHAIASVFVVFACFDVWDSLSDFVFGENRIAYETLLVMGVPLFGLQIVLRFERLRSGLRVAQRASQEVSRRRHLERAHFHRIFDRMREVVAELEADTRIEMVSRRAFDLLGWPPEELVGRRAIEFIPEESRHAFEEFWREQLKSDGGGEPTVFEVDGAHGERLYLEVSVSALELEGERRFLVLGRDVTDREETDRRLEARRVELEASVAASHDQLRASRGRLRDQERLAAVGTLASGIAHQINNPLGSILAMADFALMDHSATEEAGLRREALERIADEAHRAGRIVKSVLRFARHGSTAKWVDDLVPVVRRAVELTRAYVTACGAELSLHGDIEALPVLMSPIEIDQLVVNLVRNAAESRETGASIRVRTYADEAGANAWIEVEDDGRGIPADVQKEIFDPFFTTRLAEGGSGLGLSVALGIAEDHGGSIEIESEPAQGTRVRVRLPLAAAGGSGASGGGVGIAARGEGDADVAD